MLTCCNKTSSTLCVATLYKRVATRYNICMNTEENVDYSIVNKLLRTKTEEVSMLTTELETLRVRLMRATEERDLLQRLLQLSGDENATVATEPQVKRQTKEGGTLEDRLEDLLRSHGAPMHISEIHKSLVSSGVDLPGRGDEANIILRLRRDESRFVRTGRGTYALADGKHEHTPPTRHRKKRPKRRTKR